MVICWFMQKYTYICWIHTDAMINDAMIKTQEDFFSKIFTSHFIARVRKGCVGFYCERELEIEHNCNILAVSVVSFSFFWCSTGGPEATLLGDGFLYGILSASSPDLNSSGPKGPFGLIWLSLPHLSPTGCNSTGTGRNSNTII